MGPFVSVTYGAGKDSGTLKRSYMFLVRPHGAAMFKITGQESK